MTCRPACIGRNEPDPDIQVSKTTYPVVRLPSQCGRWLPRRERMIGRRRSAARSGTQRLAARPGGRCKVAVDVELERSNAERAAEKGVHVDGCRKTAGVSVTDELAVRCQGREARGLCCTTHGIEDNVAPTAGREGTRRLIEPVVSRHHLGAERGDRVPLLCGGDHREHARLGPTRDLDKEPADPAGRDEHRDGLPRLDRGELLHSVSRQALLG